MDMVQYVGGSAVLFTIVIIVGLLIIITKCYRKIEQGQALIRNGMGGSKVSFTGILVLPILHKLELIDISVKTVMIDRHGEEGLICMDNMRADIKVAFFVRVNKTEEDVLRVAQSIGAERASSTDALREFFEAKFSEALKTVGKRFDFVDLYNSREQFKEEILKIIGTDLNGFVLDDAAIDFLEQTSIDLLNSDNILDSEGIKKITNLTSNQKIMANQIDRDREKTIMKQDVEAREAILELKRQLAETENKQIKEVETHKAREEAETEKVRQEERLKAEKSKIVTDEELAVADENKERQVIVARKNKEKTEAVETERLDKERLLEQTEKERVVALSKIEKDKAIEVEKKNIQDVIRERVAVEKTVVQEQEKIKDTEAFAMADRDKRVSITAAEKSAEIVMVKQVKEAQAMKDAAELKANEEKYKVVVQAEASKTASELNAEEKIIMAEAYENASEKEANAKKMLAEALTAEKAAPGLAEAKTIYAMNELIEQKGHAEANVMKQKFTSEANGIEEKANAMKLFDEVGREHEEFKLKLEKRKQIELAEITNRKDIAEYQSHIMAEALKSSKIDIVGGESTFFNKIVNAVSGGKAVDKYIDSSKNLSDIKETFFNSDPEYFKTQLETFFTQFNISPEDVKNLSISAALSQLLTLADKTEDKSNIYNLLSMAERSGLSDTLTKTLKL